MVVSAEVDTLVTGKSCYKYRLSLCINANGLSLILKSDLCGSKVTLYIVSCHNTNDREYLGLEVPGYRITRT